MTERLRVALVGLGDIGQSAHLPALLRQPAVELVALVDPVPERRAAAPASAPTAASVDEVLRPGDEVAVVLATPPWVTTDLAARLLAQDRFVLAEKPIATSSAAAAPLLDLPVAQRSRLQVGLTYRHDPAMERLRALIAAGPLDGPLLVRAHIYDERRDPADPEHTERILDALAHGSPVMHEGSHVFDWLRYLLGPPVAIDDAWQLRTGTEPNLVGARLRYAGGTRALVEFGWWTDRLPRCELSFLGDRGYAVLDGYSFQLTVQTADGDDVVDFPGQRMARCFDRQLARFVELATGTGAASPGLDDGVAALTTSEEVATMAGAGNAVA